MPTKSNITKNLNAGNKTSIQSISQFEWHILVSSHDKPSVIEVLKNYAELQQVSLSINEFKKAISKGALWLSSSKYGKKPHRLRRFKNKLSIGDELHFYYDDKVLSSTVPDAILIEDLVDYSVWYKPYGMLSQGSKWSDHCTIARFAQQHLPNDRQAFIVHRLDRAATGLILIAHSKKAASALSALFEKHQLEKHYQIIVHGDHNKRTQPDIIKQDIDGKKSQSTFTCLAHDKQMNRSLINVKIDSGRKHQIRKHAASIGMPVVGDRLHGIADETELLNLQLCAVSLRFHCPLAKNEQGEKVKLERFIELPETLKPQLTLKR